MRSPHANARSSTSSAPAPPTGPSPRPCSSPRRQPAATSAECSPSSASPTADPPQPWLGRLRAQQQLATNGDPLYSEVDCGQEGVPLAPLPPTRAQRSV